MSTLKQFVILIVVGAVLGAVLVSFVSPWILSWTGVTAEAGAMCNCETLIQATLRGLFQIQLIGAALGGATAAVAGLLAIRRRSAKAATRGAPSRDAAPPPAV